MPSSPAILIIEDEPLLLESIVTKMKKAGLKPLPSKTADEALEILKNTSPLPDAIWLDYYLPGGTTGIDFMEKIKAHETWSEIPVIVVSNSASPDKVQTMLDLGAKKYFLKAQHLLSEIIESLYSFIPPK